VRLCSHSGSAAFCILMRAEAACLWCHCCILWMTLSLI